MKLLVITYHNRSKLLLWLTFCLTFSQFVCGQDSKVATQTVNLQVAGSALLAVTGPPVAMTLAGATEAGAAIQESAENNESRLRMTSQVSNGENRSITSKISEALVGTTFEVELAAPNSNFMYPEYMGTLKGLQLLSDKSEVCLVDGIGTCWSGTEANDGYVIHYVFKAIPNAPILKSSVLTVTYTISSINSDSNE